MAVRLFPCTTKVNVLYPQTTKLAATVAQHATGFIIGVTKLLHIVDNINGIFDTTKGEVHQFKRRYVIRVVGLWGIGVYSIAISLLSLSLSAPESRAPTAERKAAEIASGKGGLRPC
ncbi:hypothetical protein HAT91_02509 [Dickeya solani]|nr:hypothetical protein HAT91_02509 [Dickeya solani]